MGNRAVITTKDNYNNNGIGVYLHWNGGRDSVEAFLTYCKIKEYRSLPDGYGFARLCQVIGNYFGGGLSLGINTVNCLDCDNGDNGVYFVDGWDIVGRAFFSGYEQKSYPLDEMLMDIDKSMPKDEQIGEDAIKEFLEKEKEKAVAVNTRLEKLKKFLEDNDFKGMQSFTTRNVVGDAMENVYDEDGIVVDVCWDYGYLEFFNLTDEEFKELKNEEYVR